MEFKQPPILTNERGEIRKAGFEMEFANLDLDTTAGIIIRLFGGTHEARDKYAQKVVGYRDRRFFIKPGCAFAERKEIPEHIYQS
jgi:hypothetical protein